MSALPLSGLPHCTVDGAVARIELQRPERHNALRPADLQSLLAHLARLNADPAVRVIVLAAETMPGRPVFCAGYDVAGFNAAEHDPTLFERTVDAWASARPVTVCALSGSVHGGATDLVLACDLRVAVPDASWRMPAARLGLHYYPGGLRRYMACLGPNLARQAFLADRPLTVAELQQVALFESVVEPEALAAAVCGLAGRVAALAPLAAQGLKQSLRELAAGDADTATLRAREALTLASADFLEGRAALTERRAPCFTGR